MAAWEESTGNTVNDASATSDETFKARVEMDFQTGTDPDVLFFFNGADANSFIEDGKVVSIDTIREQYPEYAANMNDDLISPSLVDGVKYAVPVNGYWEAMFVNTEVLDAAGVAVPSADYTWDQFKEDCQKIKDAGYAPIAAALGNIPHYWWEYGIFNNGSPETHTQVPAFAFMVVFLHYPFVMNILNSFQKIGGLVAASKGFQAPWYANYIKMFQDRNMLIALKNTLILMMSTVVFQVGIALVLAILVDQIKAGAKFFRVVYFFPIVISATALGLLFNLIFLRDKGMINQFLELLGRTELIDWKDQSRALVTMLLPVMWQYVGFYFVIIVTGLNNIPDDLYEVASIDGATRWQKVRYITLPLLHNVICTCVALVRYQFKGRDFLMSVVIASMMFPAFSTIVPVLRMEASWGIVNTGSRWISLLSCALPQIAGNLSFAIIVLWGYIRSLPIDLEEAAYLEGCSTLQIFTKIVVPMTKPSFATVAIFSFLWSYNDLFTQTFFLRIQPQWAITRFLKELTILTGYRDFDLAQQAIKLGVTRFILKPSNMEELEEALGVMVHNLKKKGVTGGGNAEPRKQQEGESAAGSFIVNKALEFMRENYEHKVTLTDVAEMVGFLDMAHFSRVFKKVTGVSANEYRNTLK